MDSNFKWSMLAIVGVMGFCAWASRGDSDAKRADARLESRVAQLESDLHAVREALRITIQAGRRP